MRYRDVYQKCSVHLVYIFLYMVCRRMIPPSHPRQRLRLWGEVNRYSLQLFFEQSQAMIGFWCWKIYILYSFFFLQHLSPERPTERQPAESDTENSQV